MADDLRLIEPASVDDAAPVARKSFPFGRDKGDYDDPALVQLAAEQRDDAEADFIRRRCSDDPWDRFR